MNNTAIGKSGFFFPALLLMAAAMSMSEASAFVPNGFRKRMMYPRRRWIPMGRWPERRRRRRSRLLLL